MTKNRRNFRAKAPRPDPEHLQLYMGIRVALWRAGWRPVAVGLRGWFP